MIFGKTSTSFFLKVYYLSSSKAEATKFVFLSSHSQRESGIIKNDQMSS